jgi:hypothetical protein
LLSLIENTQFDTIYHEHFSYLSLHAVSRIFSYSNLRILFAEEISTHGGSLRVYGCHQNDKRKTDSSVTKLLEQESNRGLLKLETYMDFADRVNKIKDNLLTFLLEQKRSGKRVVAYGAAAKGNTLLNYAGIKSDLIPFVYDAAKSKQGKYMPGSHIPILSPELLVKSNPDFLLILPWNIADEVKLQNNFLIESGAKFVTAIPNLKVS